AAGSAQNWTVAQSFLDELVATHSPRVLLLGLEYNWFREELYPHDVEKDEPTRLTQFKLREPFRWIVDGKLSVPQYLAIAAGLVTKTPSGHTGMGIQALVRDKGFFSDGRMHYAPDDFPATDPRTDSHFHDTLPYVEKGEKTFFFGRHVGQPNWERFEKFARTCQEHGIELVTYFPPLARPLYDLLNKIEDRRVYVEELRAKLERFQGIEFYDLSNGTALGSTDCEYYNGTHAGDVAYSRILLDISKKNPSSALAPFLNTDYLKRTIELYSGRAVAESGFAETDFLELGCNKRPIYTTANP
ncbi:MAG: hypothetical protein HYR96_05805, partial [Deltaproteobacteria bacterium]|nr:hypothetical protein [Deltaproteobacteria bacterium]